MCIFIILNLKKNHTNDFLIKRKSKNKKKISENNKNLIKI
jgi:hypothetical protein